MQRRSGRCNVAQKGVQLSPVETPLAAKFKPEGKHFVSGIFFILGDAAKLRWAGGGGAQRPVCRVNKPKKTGASSAWARTRGQNPLVYHIFTLGPLSVIFLSVILSSCHIPVILS